VGIAHKALFLMGFTELWAAPTPLNIGGGAYRAENDYSLFHLSNDREIPILCYNSTDSVEWES
jgi:hypothetical protein